MNSNGPTNVQLKQQRNSQQVIPLKPPAQSQYSAFTELQRSGSNIQPEDLS
jgi:hypothetical protein